MKKKSGACKGQENNGVVGEQSRMDMVHRRLSGGVTAQLSRIQKSPDFGKGAQVIVSV